MKQTIEIEVPDGKKAVWKDNKVVFEDIKPKLPETWEEYCSNNKITKNEFYINTLSNIAKLTQIGGIRDSTDDRNLLPNQEAAEAHLALMQLHQLRDCYRQGWVPDYTDAFTKFGIVRHFDFCSYKYTYGIMANVTTPCFLSFQSKEIAQEFLDNFRDLIEQAGDLI